MSNTNKQTPEELVYLNYLDKNPNAIPFVESSVQLLTKVETVGWLFKMVHEGKIKSLSPYLQRILLTKVWKANNYLKSKSYIRDLWKGLGQTTPFFLVPLELVLSNIEEVEGVSFVGQDSFKSGYLAGKLISYGNKVESNVLIFKITSNIENSSKTIFNLKKIQGFYSYFKDNESHLPKYNFTEISIKDTTQYNLKIEMFIGIDAVFVLNSRVHLVAEFIKKNKLEKPKKVSSK